MKSTIDPGDVTDVSCRIEGECDNANLDDLILASIEARSLGVEDDAFEGNSGRGFGATVRGASFVRTR